MMVQFLNEFNEFRMQKVIIKRYDDEGDSHCSHGKIQISIQAENGFSSWSE